MLVQTPTLVPQRPIVFSDRVVSEDINTHFSYQSNGTLPFKTETAKQRCIPNLLPNKSGLGKELLSLCGDSHPQLPALASSLNLAEAVQCSLGVDHSREKR